MLGFACVTPLQAQIRDTVPEPRSVMRKSLVVPGWGQVVNGHKWKVPVIYTALGGLAAYTLYSNNRYEGYRAAYYNSLPANTDQRFGPTPSWVTADPSLYRQNRDLFRNRRDLGYVYVGLAWGFNALDAYIFAHLKDFDVSDDVSMRVRLGLDPVPSVRFTIPIR
jgi:hypothetical protein